MDAPTDWNSLEPWCQSRHLPLPFGKRRFLLAEAARAVAADPILRDEVVLRGAAALELIWGGTRPTTDVDFISLTPPHAFISQREHLLGSIQSCVVHRLARRVPRQDPPPYVSIHVSPVMFDSEYTAEPLDGDARLFVATIAHILAEKLYATLCCSRPMSKRQTDLWDIASFRERTTVSDQELVRRVHARMASRPHNEILAPITPTQATDLLEKLTAVAGPLPEPQRPIDRLAVQKALHLVEQILPYHPPTTT